MMKLTILMVCIPSLCACTAATDLNESHAFPSSNDSNFTLLAASGFNIYYSVDKGASWVQSSISPFDSTIGEEFLEFANAGDDIFASTWGNKLFCSSDQGQSWTAIKTPLDPYVGAVVSNGNTLLIQGLTQNAYSSSSFTTAISTDLGTTWIVSSDSVPRFNGGTYAYGINRQTLFIGNSYNFYRSSDRGRHWSRSDIPNGNPTSNGHQMITADSILFWISNSGIIYSRDNGDSWHSCFIDTIGEASNGAIAYNGSELYTGGTEWMAKSTNSGIDWERLPMPDFLQAQYYDISSIVTRGKYVFTALDPGIMYSIDHGETWQRTSDLPGNSPAKVIWIK